MKTALIGYTGFLGSNLLRQTSFTDLYNSKNIQLIKNESYDLIVSAGNSSLLWKANLEPEKDWQSINSYMNCITSVKAKQFVLFSTIEVYNTTNTVDENTTIDAIEAKPYGKHRYRLEEFIQKKFKHSTIIRLPNLFGPGLKKNFIYDLLHNNRLDLSHKDSVQQWYNLDMLYHDMTIALTNELPLVNFATEPIKNQDLALQVMGINFESVTTNSPRKYNMQTKYAKLFDSDSNYLYNKEETIRMIKTFIKTEMHHEKVT